MSGSYNLWTVLLSLAVAGMASYTALNLAGRIYLAGSHFARRIWLMGGAVVLGVGVWSMHFVGMLAFKLPIELGYDLSITLWSLVIAIVAGYVALYVATRRIMTWRRLIGGGLVMGAGISGMHYLGMAAMRMAPGIAYDPLLFAGSIAIAIGASLAALWVAHALRQEDQRFLLVKRLAASFVMALAITGMHYTGMAAAHFPAGSICMAANSDGMAPQTLTFLVAVFTVAIMLATLILSTLESRYSASKRNLTGSLEKLNVVLLRMATTDTLTDLANRTTLVKAIDDAVALAKRQRHHVAVLFMDLDGFKSINDSLGHAAGDRMLKAFAQRLRETMGDRGTIARIGGDEFVVLIDRLEAAEDAGPYAHAIKQAMQRDLMAGDTALRVTPSIGIATYPRDGDSVDSLLSHADLAMYAAKQDGRNTYRFYESTMGENAVRILAIQQALQDALAQNRFTLHFQPKFSGLANHLTGAEALIRWTDPKLGELQPSDFIPIAEKSGQIIDIGHWVLREVCRYLCAWDAHGRAPLKVAVNLSPVQLRHAAVVAQMRTIVDSYGVAPERIMFEITETVAMNDPDLTARIFADFHAQGFEIAIDDFGTGYSSLAYLQQFRVQQLKIDRFFTNGLDAQGDQGKAVVSAIVALAHSLGMQVVAEGVETESQLQALRTLECDQVQGFLLERPMTAESFEHFLDRYTSRTAPSGDEPPPDSGVQLLGTEQLLPAV